MGRAMAQVVERYRGSRGDVTQVVVGRQLTPPLKLEADEEAVIDVEEIFSFRESGASLVRQPLGRWQADGPLALTYQPRLGPQDFHGNTVVTASFPYDPYFMIGDKCEKKSGPNTDQVEMQCVNQKPRVIGCETEARSRKDNSEEQL
ncbi:hypothetical protein E2C01_001913 [Portunus trituberculatus]|uniref:Uncharacterized protein n=1 Tax=Portunus trituberculatus TaxID=210409 RepID=A0A5B7CJ56_PORTR|nr:hypothetical protein [Portunus trituberculatus]